MMNPEVFCFNPQVLVPNPKVLCFNPQVLMANPKVFCFNPQVLMPNPKVFAIYPRVYRYRQISTSETQKKKNHSSISELWLTHSFYLNTGSLNCSSFCKDDFSTCSCRLFPWESIVTTAVKPLTRMCHIASGTPNSIRSTPSTFSIHSA
jgi:hypothetical protein